MNSERSFGLGSLVMQSAIWRVSKNAIDNALRFITFAVLARFLTPAEFGAFAIASVFITVGGIVSSGGMGDVLIRENEIDDELKSTVFWANFLLTLSISLILVLVSPLIASAVGAPDLVWILSALAGALLLAPFGSIPSALALRDLRVKELEFMGFASSLASSAASIGIALNGGGLWALAAGQIVSSVIFVGLVAARFPWWPSATFSMPRLRSFASFSGNMLASQILQTLIVRIQELFASTFLSLASVGIYRIGSRITELLSAAFVGPVASLSLIPLSRARDDPDRYQSMYAKMLSLISVIYCPMIIGFAAIAQDAIPMLFGPQWVGSVIIAQVLCLLAPATVISYFYGPVLSAAGRSDVLRTITITQLLGTLAACAVGVVFGITGLAVAFVVRSYLTLPLQLRWVERATGLTTRSTIVAAGVPALSAVIMAVAVQGAQLGMQHWPPLIRIFMSVGIGGALYALIMYAVFSSYTKQLVIAVRTLVAARRTAGGA